MNKKIFKRSISVFLFLLFGSVLSYAQIPVLSKVDGGASWSVELNKPIDITSSSYNRTLDETDFVVVIRHTGATITLPAPSDADGRVYILTNNNNSSHTINIAPTGTPPNTTQSSFVDIASNAPTSTGSFSIPGKSSMTVHSNGNTWYQIQ